MRKLNETFLKFFPVSFFDGDQGAAGGAASPAPKGGAGGDPTVSFDEDIPAEALAGDPELQRIITEEARADKKSGSTDDKGDGSEFVEGNTDTGIDEGVADEGIEKPEAIADGSDEDLSAAEFEDDVIPGLKGEHLKVLPKEALAALADFQSSHSELSTKTQKTEESLTKLLADPIVKRRMELLKSGKTDYEVRGLNGMERQSILKSIAETGDLSSEEAERVFSVLEKSLDSVVRESANDRLQGLIQEDSRQRRVEETQRSGRQALLELGKFNKSLAFKETDASKFWNDDGSLNNKHPESKLFGERIVPLLAALHETGQTYDSLARLSKKSGGQAVYALVAALSGLPVAINTSARDAKIIKDRFAVFLKKQSVAGLDTKGGSAVPPDRSRNAPVIKNGYDIVKLAEGGTYYEKAYASKGANAEHMDMIDALADEGEALQAKGQKVKH